MISLRLALFSVTHGHNAADQYKRTGGGVESE